jgi:hypothetical protein
MVEREGMIKKMDMNLDERLVSEVVELFVIDGNLLSRNTKTKKKTNQSNPKTYGGLKTHETSKLRKKYLISDLVKPV